MRVKQNQEVYNEEINRAKAALNCVNEGFSNSTQNLLGNATNASIVTYTIGYTSIDYKLALPRTVLRTNETETNIKPKKSKRRREKQEQIKRQNIKQ